MFTHYGASMIPRNLREQAEFMVELLKKKFPKKTANFVLFYSGMSGVASATALSYAMLDKIKLAGMVYVRKKNEESHGENIEISLLNDHLETDIIVPIFVDDFICNGVTCRYVMHQIMNRIEDNSLFDTDDIAMKKFHRKLKRRKYWWVAQLEYKKLITIGVTHA